jgi:hypothetical protein
MTDTQRMMRLKLWLVVFFASFVFVMWSWSWSLQPVWIALSTFAGFGLMLLSYRFGIDRCLPAR